MQFGARGFIGSYINYIDSSLVGLITASVTIDSSLVISTSGQTVVIDSYLENEKVRRDRNFYSTKLKNIWQGIQATVLQDFNDVAVIYFNPVRTSIAANGTGYDSFFGESTNPASPDNLSDTTVTTTANPITIRCKFRSDLYGATISNEESQQYLNIGKFQQSDGLLTVLAESVWNDPSDKTKGTIFDKCQYITIEGQPFNFEIDTQKFRGFGDLFVLDVWLKKTNKY